MIYFAGILAQTTYQNRLKGLRGAFDDKPSDPADFKLIVVLAIALLAVILFSVLLGRIRLRAERKAAPRHPEKLFNKVMKRMGLGLTDRCLMRLLARSADLSQPTVMFLSADLFERHTRRWIDSITIKSLQDYIRRRIGVVAGAAFPKSAAAATMADTS